MVEEENACCILPCVPLKVHVYVLIRLPQLRGNFTNLKIHIILIFSLLDYEEPAKQAPFGIDEDKLKMISKEEKIKVCDDVIELEYADGCMYF